MTKGTRNRRRPATGTIKGEQAKPRAHALFDRVGSRGWRDSGHFTFIATSRPLREWIAARLPSSRRGILSIGCGGGELEKRLAQAGHRVVGFDISLPMLKSARRRGMALAVLGDAQVLPFDAARFDIVLLCETVGYVDLDRAFGEVARVLKPGGRFIVTTYLPHVPAHARYHKYSIADIRAALARAGFRVAAPRFLRANRLAAVPVARQEDAMVLFVEARKRRDAATGPARRRAGTPNRPSPRRRETRPRSA